MKSILYNLILAFLLLFTVVANAQQGTITGNTQVDPGDYEEYGVSFPYWHSASIVSWSVSGGTLLWSSQYGCAVQWDNTNGVGSISASEDLYGQYAELQVFIGEPVPYINIASQTVPYGGVPPYDPFIYFSYPPAGTITYQWQEWSDISQTWNNISGQTSDVYVMGAVTANKLYRCVVDVGGVYYNLETSVNVQALNPGLLGSAGSLNLNAAVPGLSLIPGSGGFCSSLTYAWEMSVENGPWQFIGNTVNTPPGLNLVGDIKLRRKVICGSQELYTNIVSIIPNYTAGDFENRNYVREVTVLKSSIASWQQADQLIGGDKFQSTVYFDGQGKTIQKVDKEMSVTASGTWNDIVTPHDYQINTNKTYLPYSTYQLPGKFKTNALTDQATYIRNYYNEPSTAPTYTLTQLEASPLARPVGVQQPGQSWGGSNIGPTTVYGFNETNEQVIKWYVDGWPANWGYYAAGSLQKTITTDEHGIKTILYTDLDGDVILRKVQNATGGSLTTHHAGWLCTYYVYDEWKRLIWVIPPKAMEQYGTGSGYLEIASHLGIWHSYDMTGRLIQKGGEAYVYDNKDRPVLSQDANQRTRHEWTFSLYDELNRKVATGIFIKNATAAAMQTHVSGLNNGRMTLSLFVGNGTYQSIVVDNPVAGSTGSNSYCNSCDPATLTYTTIIHYDDYGYTGAKASNSAYTLAYNTSTYPNSEPVTFSSRTYGLITGQKLRITDNDNNPLNDKFLFSTMYYDEKGREQQSLADNVMGGTDIVTTQWDFSGRKISSYTSHTNPSQSYTILTKNDLDKIGRIVKISKNFNNTGYKSISTYSFAELGQLKSKNLSPDYGTSGLETIDYDYNIRGWLTGINKDYALSDDNYTQWNRYFGLYLGFDNRDGRVNNSLLNGNISGTIWRSQGDNSPRKYDYTYDYSDRFTGATFKQKNKPSATWLGSEMDFSSTVTYDGNSNIATLKRWGVVPGVNTPMLIDDLQYDYFASIDFPLSKGNVLKTVTDVSTGLGSNNGILGDYKNGTNVGDDYVYDAAGNVVKDLSKEIVDGSTNGIIYNYLNKPRRIVVKDKFLIELTYDATGERVSRKVTPITVAAPNPPVYGTPVTTWYSGEFVYNETGSQLALDYIIHEEGRLKVITPHAKVNNIDYELNAGTAGVTLLGSKQGAFEFFIKDNLGNIRMTLTEEVQQEFYLATMESTTAIADVEERLFGKVDPTTGVPGSDNELQRTRDNNSTPTSSNWPNKTNDYVKLTASDPNKRIGPNMILKVMAGDIISTKVNYYFANYNDVGPGGNPVNDVVTNLLGALNSPGKVTNIGKVQRTDIGSVLGSDIPFGQFVNGQNAPGQLGEPRAYLNIVFLDEQFKFVEPDLTTSTIGSGSVRMDDDNNPNAEKILEKKAPKNGWVFVYLSNQSNEDVYFDDLYVTQEHSRIAEENHYYPYGLKIASISSRAFNKAANKRGFQGDYAEEDTETGWTDYALRTYDPQIARWLGQDPYSEFSSPFVAFGADPINYVDPEGGDIFSGMSLFMKTLSMTLGGAIVGTAAGVLFDDDKNAWKWGMWGGIIAGGATYILTSPERIKVLITGTSKMAFKEFKDYKLSSALFGSFVKSLVMEVLSLGKIVVIRGENKKQIGEKINKYFKRNPRAKKIDDLTIDFHGGYYGDTPKSLNANSLDNIKDRLDENSTVIMGQCKCASESYMADLAKNINGATLIAHHGYQNNFTFMTNGSYVGNYNIMGPGHEHRALSHDIYAGGVLFKKNIYLATHISNFGKITYRELSQKYVTRLLNRWSQNTGKIGAIIKAILWPTNFKFK